MADQPNPLDGVKMAYEPDMSQAGQDWLRSQADMGSDRMGRYTKARDYYDGDHKVHLTDRARKYLQANQVAYCENWCEPVVDVYAELLVIDSVTVSPDAVDETSDQQADDVNDWLARWLEDQEFEARHGDANQDTVKLGDMFIIVEVDSDGVPQLCIHQPDCVKPVYRTDRPDEMSHAIHVWDTNTKGPVNPEGVTVRRMNVYWPDRVEKWFTQASDTEAANWAPWVDEDDEQWPVEWVRDGKPRGIPVFHLRNRRHGHFGRSELESVYPQQNALNKHCVDLNEVIDYHGAPQRWASGVDSTSTMQTNPGMVWTVRAADARFGQFEPTNPVGILKAIEGALQRISGRSRTPMHALMSTAALPSGESLKTANAGLVSKARWAFPRLGPKYRAAIRMCGLLAIDYGSDTPAGLEDALDTLAINWKDPEPRNELEFRQALILEGMIGVSQATRVEKLGYDPAREAERRKGEVATGQQAMASALDTGNPAVTGGTYD